MRGIDMMKGVGSVRGVGSSGVGISEVVDYQGEKELRGFAVKSTQKLCVGRYVWGDDSRGSGAMPPPGEIEFADGGGEIADEGDEGVGEAGGGGRGAADGGTTGRGSVLLLGRIEPRPRQQLQQRQVAEKYHIAQE